MQKMQVLVDRNLLVELLINRTGFVEQPERLWHVLESAQIQGYLTDAGIRNVQNLISDPHNEITAERVIAGLLQTTGLQICEVNAEIRKRARSLTLRDYELSVEVAMVEALGLDAIVTERPQDYAGTSIRVLTVSELVDVLRLRRLYWKSSENGSFRHSNLHDWMHNNGFDPGWQSVEELGLLDSAFSFRRLHRSRGKILRWQNGQCAALVVNLLNSHSLEEDEIEIEVKVCALPQQPYLPYPLRVEILDQTGESVMLAEPTEQNSSPQLEFSIEPGEQFKVRISLSDDTITESFGFDFEE